MLFNATTPVFKDINTQACVSQKLFEIRDPLSKFPRPPDGLNMPCKYSSLQISIEGSITYISLLNQVDSELRYETFLPKLAPNDFVPSAK